MTDNLLMLVNSIGVCAVNRMDTARQAFNVLGREQVRRWVQLAMFAGG